jgi:predicted phosphodiesterase
MRIAVYSDVHGNLPAMKAFIKHSAEKNIQYYVFLGDAVNYGGKPQECLDEIIKLGLVGHFQEINALTDASTIQNSFAEKIYAEQLQGKILLGNNDAVCCGLEDPGYFADHAKASAILTRDKLLSEWHKAFLRSLPIEAPMNVFNHDVPDGHEDRVITIRFNHSSPGSYALGEWHYIRPTTNMEYLEYFFDRFTEKICFVGHSHIPCAFVQAEGQILPVSFPMPTKHYDKAIINVGTVGQPRGHTYGCYVVLDAEKKVIELEWFQYNIRQAMQDIYDAGLPEYNARRLLSGSLKQKKSNAGG